MAGSPYGEEHLSYFCYETSFFLYAQRVILLMTFFRDLCLTESRFIVNNPLGRGIYKRVCEDRTSIKYY